MKYVVFAKVEQRLEKLAKYVIFAKAKQRLEKLVKYVVFAKAKQRLEKLVKYVPFGHQKAPFGGPEASKRGWGRQAGQRCDFS